MLLLTRAVSSFLCVTARKKAVSPLLFFAFTAALTAWNPPVALTSGVQSDESDLEDR